MSVDIKVISVDEKFGKDILKLKGYILYICRPFRFLRLWLYPNTTIIKGMIYLDINVSHTGHNKSMSPGKIIYCQLNLCYGPKYHLPPTLL